MARLTAAGEQTLSGKNFVTHTRIYVNDVLQVDTSAGLADAPVIEYQINHSRKLGAARLALNVANPGGDFSFKRQADPVFAFGNRIRLQEGIAVGQETEWFTRFTGIIVSQVASNTGGRPALKVYAMDNMKLLLDYLPNDELYYRPTVVKVSGEVLNPVAGDNFTHYRGNQDNLPWVDIPYPIFYKDGAKIKENYEIDLIHGEVYFGEIMWKPVWNTATKTSATVYTVPAALPASPLVRRSFKLVRYGPDGTSQQTPFEYSDLPAGTTFTIDGNTIAFSQDPFLDLGRGADWDYIDKTILATAASANQVTADYWYYDDATNQAEEVIRDLAIKAGFSPEQIILEPTEVMLKPLRFTSLSIKNGFEALQKIKQQLSPNYIITCDVDGNLRGYYAAQALTGDYELDLIKKIEAPISEEGLYTVAIGHGIDLNPGNLGKTAVAENLGPNFSGSLTAVFNKNVDDQVSWHWVQMNNDTPPEFPIDLMKITLAEAKKIEEISILIGDYNGGTIQQSMSVQISEDGENWFYIDRSSRGISGASSQWVTVKGGELEYRKIKYVKIAAEAGFDWLETHTYSVKGGWFLNPKISVYTDNYYHWFLAIKEIQIWEENTIAVTSVVGNCIDIGDGARTEFYIPNTPVVPGSEIIYVEGQQAALGGYTLDPSTGKVIFLYAPTGVVTADYAVETKLQSVSNAGVSQRYTNNVTVINPPGTVAFTGGAITADSPEYKLLKRVGLKKIGLKQDNYLNSFSDVKKRGEEMLQEITRLEETLDVEVVYRPDADICQTAEIFDATLGLAGNYFIEEITESKQGYKPSLSIKVSNYSA
jgi:hypothetical protein